MNYTVNVSIPETLANLAKKRVKAGYYSSFSEVIREALRNLLMAESTTEVPVFKMSKKAEKIALKAMEDYRKGKAIEIKSFKDLE